MFCKLIGFSNIFDQFLLTASNSYANNNSSQQENAIPHAFISFPAAFLHNTIYGIGRAEQCTGQLPNRCYKSNTDL